MCQMERPLVLLLSVHFGLLYKEENCNVQSQFSLTASGTFFVLFIRRGKLQPDSDQTRAISHIAERQYVALPSSVHTTGSGSQAQLHDKYIYRVQMFTNAFVALSLYFVGIKLLRFVPENTMAELSQSFPP